MDAQKPSLSSRNLIFFLVLVFFMLWLPRAFALDTFVYVDEPSWVQRSANFYYALRHRDYIRTAQNLSPGVTTMWVGAAGFFLEDRGYAAAAPGYFGELPPPSVGYTVKYDHLEAFLNGRGIDPLAILAASRAVMVLLISFTLLVAFIFAARLFGWWPALVAFALIAFEPFFLVNSRFNHLDGPMSVFLLLSLLAFLNYLYLDRGKNLSLVVSAVAAAAAWLSKQQGILILPTIFVLLFLHTIDLAPGRNLFERLRSLVQLRRYIKPVVTWGVIFMVSMIAMWPAMWQNPSLVLNLLILQPFRYLFSSSGKAATAAQDLAEVGEAAIPLARDWLFYPNSFLWLTTPIILIGLLLGLFAFFRRWSLLSAGVARRSYAALWLFALLFTFAVSLSLKVAERYYLPFYLAMALLAALGWYSSAVHLASRLRPSVARAFAPAILSLAVAGQMLSSLPLYPYYVPYNNLLLGGSARAAQIHYRGFGEGLELAAAYLNQKPDAQDLDVISWYAYGPFSSYFVGRSHDVQILSRDISTLSTMDYLVTYRNAWDRPYLAEFNTLLESVEPEYTVELFGLEYARIYAVPDLPPELFALEIQTD